MVMKISRQLRRGVASLVEVGCEWAVHGKAGELRFCKDGRRVDGSGLVRLDEAGHGRLGLARRAKGLPGEVWQARRGAVVQCPAWSVEERAVLARSGKAGMVRLATLGNERRGQAGVVMSCWACSCEAGSRPVMRGTAWNGEAGDAR